MAKANSSFWSNLFFIVLIIAIVIGIITGNTIITVVPIGIVVLLILVLVIASPSTKHVKPDNFLIMTENYPKQEKNYVKEAKQIIDEQKDDRVKLFLKGIISYYDKSNKGNETIYVCNELTERQQHFFNDMVAAFEKLCGCEKIWFISSEKANTSLKSSAAYSVERKKTVFAKGCFNHVTTKFCEQVPMFRDLYYSYYIYPQFVVKAKTPVNFEIIPLDKISISYKPQRFVESAYEWNWPKDGQIIERTYQYVNKDGTPDKRYTLNKLVPVYLYGEISVDELGLTYHTSKNDVAESFVNAIKKFKYSLAIREIVEEKTPQNNTTSNLILSNDIIEITEYDPLLNEAAQILVSSGYASTSLLQRKLKLGYNRAGRIMDVLESIGIIGPFDGSSKRELRITDLATLDSVFSRVKVVDSQELSIIPMEDEAETIEIAPKRQKVATKKKENPIDELNALIGLSSVKTDISDLTNLVKIQKMRESRGMKTSDFSYHCIFTGNPGTGKTTVARIVAEIYKQLGVLKKGHLIETDRSGLVGEYVGQTAPKTNAIIDKALDGVLFIDEAYSLVQGGQNDYGKEAIATLLKRMEDDRDRLVVILAGYTKEMSEFINSNSGLQSRFNRYIYFPDYSSDELLDIFRFITKKNDCVASDEAITKIKEYIEEIVAHKDQNFGNARFVRNLFERIITQQANRLTQETNITNEMLSKIEVVDVENALK